MNKPSLLKRRAFWISLVVILLAAGIAGAMAKKAKQAPPAASAPAAAALELLQTDLAVVKPTELRRLLPISGSLRALRQAAVKARIAGDVREVLVREGEAVREGQVLVRMDAADYQARVDQAMGALNAARGQLDIATKARDNNRALLDKGFISRNAFDNADSQTSIARANVDSAKGALEVARKALGDTVIRAPISGLVSSRSVQPGEKVSPDNRLLDVVDLRQLELEAAVPAADIVNVALGQEVRVRIEGLQNPLTGKVARINPSTTAGSRSIPIYILIDNPDSLLRAGMFAEARLTLAARADVLSLPQTAVRQDGGSPYVYAIEDGKLTRKAVTLGMTGESADGPMVEVLTGLGSGARIVRSNLGTLRIGTPVKVAPAGGLAADMATSS